MPVRGVEAFVLTVSGVQTLISPPLKRPVPLMHHSYESQAERQRDREEGQPVCLARLEDSALNINNLSQVSVSHIWLMHAIVNNHAVSYDQETAESTRDWENVSLSRKWNNRECCEQGQCCMLGGRWRVGGWRHQTASLALQATSDLSPLGVRSLSRYLNLSAAFWPVLPF